MKCLFYCICSLLINSISAQKLSNLSINKLRENLGTDLKGYEFYSYPTNNFGVGTSCIKKWIPKGDMVADMISSYGLTGYSSSDNIWRTVNGFAYLGSDGISIKVNENIESVLTLEMLLPKLLNILNLNADLKNANAKSLKLTIDSGYKRFLNHSKFMNFIRESNASEIQKAFNQKKLLVATGDFIITGFSLTISKSDTLGASIIAKLDSTIKAGKNVILDKASLEMSIVRNSDGYYTISSRKPIIIAVYVKKQTPLSTYSENDNFDSWDSATINDFE